MDALFALEQQSARAEMDVSTLASEVAHHLQGAGLEMPSEGATQHEAVLAAMASLGARLEEQRQMLTQKDTALAAQKLDI